MTSCSTANIPKFQIRDGVMKAEKLANIYHMDEDDAEWVLAWIQYMLKARPGLGREAAAQITPRQSAHAHARAPDPLLGSDQEPSLACGYGASGPAARVRERGPSRDGGCVRGREPVCPGREEEVRTHRHRSARREAHAAHAGPFRSNSRVFFRLGAVI